MGRVKRYPVYIPTKGRAHLARHTLPTWISIRNLILNLVVEPQDVDSYEEALWDAGLEDHFSLRVLDRNDQGISYARNGVVNFAAEDGANGFVMSDDDLKVHEGVDELARFMEKNKMAAGVSFCHRLNLFWDNLKWDTGAHPTAGGSAQLCVGLSVPRMQETKGYLRELGPYEDTDIILQLLKAGYGPWYIHTGAKGALGGKRYEDGGISAMEKKERYSSRAAKEKRIMEVLCREHGAEYFRWHKASKHLQEQGLYHVIRFQWMRIYRDFNPRAFHTLYER